jgi:pSer/pThr/pTyr-binding forkhead associated (FHA) protein
MKSFLTACGVDDSLQLVVERQNANEGELRLLYQPFAVIGRDPRADVVLDHPQVSRRHVYLQVVEGRAFWVDLESRTGTNGERKPQKFGWLEGGRILCAGPFVIRRFVGDSQADSTQGEPPRNTPLVALTYNHTPLPEVALEFLNGPSQSMSRPVHRVMSLIGSARGCKFRLTDPSVSRFHGSLLRNSAGLWIVDLLGQRGITVNEVPVRSSHLADGDVLRIGRYQIRVRCRLRGQESENGLPDRGRTMVVPRLVRQNRALNGLKFPDWAVAATSVEPGPGGAKEAQFSLPIQAASSFPKVKAMPSDATFTGNLTQSELADSMLVPLVNQFGLMQQQMFDQFQQAMAMMVQMFGTMHRDQMEVIRTELDQLRELTEEFHALKNELAHRSRAEMASSKAVTSKSSNGLEVAPVSPSPVIPPSSLAFSTPGQQPSLEPRHSPTSPLSGPSETPPISEQLQETGLCSPIRASGAGLAVNSDRDTVVWLHQRILSLQRERESRWQKILKLLPGMS